MKRIVFLFLLLPFLQSAQSFHRGSVILDLGTGLEYYNTQKNYHALANSSDTASSGQSAGVNLNAGLEVGLSKHFGIGARGKMNTFFKQLDAVTKQQTKIQTLDLLLNFNWHPVRRKKFDLVLGTDFGLSSVDMTFQNLNQLWTNGKGVYADVYLMPRIYWKRLGFNVRFNLPFATYNSLNTTGDQLASQSFAVSAWKGKGYGISVGLQFRIFK